MRMNLHALYVCDRYLFIYLFIVFILILIMSIFDKNQERPSILPNDCSPLLADLMRQCWAAAPANRFVLKKKNSLLFYFFLILSKKH